MQYSGTAEREGLVGLYPYQFFENYKEILRKKVFLAAPL